MESGLRSLWVSLRTFVGFWFAFLCATACNTLIPLDALRESWIFKHFITDSMIDLRLRFLKAAVPSGKLDITGAILSLLYTTSVSFLGYFKEIFVIVTLFHFTPILQGEYIGIYLPRWLRRLLPWVGLRARSGGQQGGDEFDGEEEEYGSAAEEEGASEPPELEDCSDILLQASPQVSQSSRKGLASPIVAAGASGSPPSSSSAQSSAGASEGSIPGSPSTRLAQPSLFSQPPLSPLRYGRAKDRYVYDPVFGVIPQETRDLWQSQESDSNHRRQALLDAVKAESRAIPPIRFSSAPS